MKFKLFTFLTSIILLGGSAFAQNQYGLPDDIKEGNILHCFDWKLNDIKAELPNIAAAGFVAIQTSPMQRNVPAGWNWSEAYRPADFAFSMSGLGTANALTQLCEEAEKYGIKVIVDVVFNHVDNGTYHNSWWDSNGRLRTTTSYINYSNRNSITHDRLGDYPEVNTEQPEVIERAKAYIEELKGYGVKGIRFDAAKHISLPSEGSDFWKEVTSVPGLFYYGEILGSPGGSQSTKLLQEYATYMSVTDDTYSNGARNNDGVPSQKGQWSLSIISQDQCVYWGESHDTYSNVGGTSKNVAQAKVDRAYAILACRDGGVGLYFSRPSKTNFNDIKLGQKGSTHFKDKEVAEINKFKNAMVGKADCYSKDASSSAASVTRKDGGAVIVRKGGAGQVTVPNGDSYCPEGTYYDRISGNVFTVTASTISGQVGSTGIAVIYGDYKPGDEDKEPDTPVNPSPEEDVYVYCTNPHNWSNVYIYMYSTGGAVYTNSSWPGEAMTKNGDLWEYKVPSELATDSRVIFNDGSNGSQYPQDTPGEESGYLLEGKSMISDGNNWMEYQSAGIGDIEFDDFDSQDAIWFNLNGMQINRPNEPGIYIRVNPKGKTQKILIK